LSTETSEETLSNFFKENNFSLKKTKFLLDTNGKSKGAGFVELHDASQAAEAVK
jgi:RNA recognition motif-containing protein